MTEDHIEQLILTWFQDSGWEYHHGLNIAPDGDTLECAVYRQVLLHGPIFNMSQNAPLTGGMH